MNDYYKPYIMLEITDRSAVCVFWLGLDGGIVHMATHPYR